MSSGRSWSEWEHGVLRGMFTVRSFAEIADILGRTTEAVRSRAQILGLRQGKKKIWTRAEDRMLRKLYPDNPSAELARRFNCSIFSVYQRAKRLEIHKSAEYMERCGAECGARVQQFGASHRYPKGHVPANKGLRRPGWSVGRMAQTQFVAGRAPQTWQPVGSTTISDGYHCTKMGDGGVSAERPSRYNWLMDHIYEWESRNGPVPPGYAVAFKDGNRAHTSIENLELISRKELAKRNSIHNLPPELKQVIMLTGALKRKLRNRKEKLNAEEQSRGPAQPPLRDTGVAERLRA